MKDEKKVNLTVCVEERECPKGDLFGIFFEDLNHAADGGLYGEMVQNRNFSSGLSAWETRGQGNGGASVELSIVQGMEAGWVNQYCAKLSGSVPESGMANIGYNKGMFLEEGKNYRFSGWMKAPEGGRTKIRILLESQGEILSEAACMVSGQWEKKEILLKSSKTAEDGTLVLLLPDGGSLILGFVSLFPEETFLGRKNGMRKDLAEALWEMHPRFLRFPGGCLVHCGSLDAEAPNSMYRWKKTLGPVEERPDRISTWNTHQTLGLGYFEYFQFCEDIGAKPIPVIPAGFDPHTQKGAPMDNMQEWIEEALDLIEFAKGGTDSRWGAVRASMGHPEPFPMEYLAIGNEEQGDGFFERFHQIIQAVREKAPEIKVIGTAGPFAAGGDFEKGWQEARREKADLADEHYYQSPEWFLANHHRYDDYPPKEPYVMLGEYASQGNSWFHSLSEASFMIGLERNCDKVKLACYAPLLCNVDYVNWEVANLIWFDAARVVKTSSYYVQKLFMNYQGDWKLPCIVDTDLEPELWMPSWSGGDIVFGSHGAEVIYRDIEIIDEESGACQTLGEIRLKAGECRLAAQMKGKRYSITFTAEQISEEGSGFIVEFDRRDGENYRRLSLGGWNKANNTLEEVIHGKMSCLSQYPFLWKKGQSYRINIQVSKTEIAVWVDGEAKQKVKKTEVVQEPLYCSASWEEKREAVILKMVNVSDSPRKGRAYLKSSCRCWSGRKIFLGGYEPTEENTLEKPDKISPKERECQVTDGRLDFELPARAVSIFVLSKEEEDETLV